MGYATQVETEGGVLHPIGASLYGTCNARASDAEKVVYLPNFDTLLTGVMVQVKFTNGNTAANPTLNVNSTGAHPIYLKGTSVPGTTEETSWAAQTVIPFTFDGNYWRITGTGNMATLAANLRTEMAAASATAAANLKTAMTKIAPEYSASSTYDYGDVVYYEGSFYRCISDITTAEAWDATHWTAVILENNTEGVKKIQANDTLVGQASVATVTYTQATVTSEVPTATIDVLAYELVTTENQTFRYSGTDWYILVGGQMDRVVQLATYGITVTYPEGVSVAAGDEVSTTYTAGVRPFMSNLTYPEYPYRARIPITGVKATMVPQVFFAEPQAILGMFAPVAETYDGGVYIWSTNVPDESFTIPVIICWG